MKLLRILLAILVLAAQKAIPLQVQTVYKLVSGLQMERVPSPSSHFYKEYVPLVYQFSIPRWNKTSTGVYGSQNCNTTHYTKFFTTCPVLYFLGEMHERFSEYLGNNQPLVVSLGEISAKPETALIPFDCELVRPHFDDIFVDKVTLDEYLSRLKACSTLGSQEFIQGITSYVYNISGIYLEMRRNFYSEYWLKIDLLDGRVDAALWANAINNINSLMFQNYMMEANRWKMAVMDCEAGRIPSTILPPSLLSDTLTDMLDSLSTQNLLPTVSTDTVGNYYKSKLADCTFTNDTFLVRILIPVIPENERFLLVKVAPIPFYYQDSETQTDWKCQIDSDALPRSDDHEQTYVLVDLLKSIAYESDCKPGKLCHIPTPLHPRKISPCATAAFNWERYKFNNEAITDLLKHCPIQCTPVNKFDKGLLKHIAPFEYFWFNVNGKTNSNVTISCRDHITQDYNIDVIPIFYGSRSFEITCDCQLTYRSKTFKPKPCAGLSQDRNQGKVQITNLAPIQWYSKEQVAKNKIKEFWNVPEEFFTKYYSADLVTQSIKVPKSDFVRGSSVNSESNTVVIIFTILSLILVIMVVALAWRLHSLIAQLEGMGFNVKGGSHHSSYNVASSSSSGSQGGQQVLYRNMGSLVDSEGLLIDEAH